MVLEVAVDDAFGVTTLVCEGVIETEGVSEGDIPPSGVVEGDGDTLPPPLPLVTLQIICSACLDPVEEPIRSVIEHPSGFSFII